MMKRGLEPLASDATPDRKSTRLNSSHLVISYAVFCLKKKKSITLRTYETRSTGRFTTRALARETRSAVRRGAVRLPDRACEGHLFYRLCSFFNDTATTEIYTLSLHDALPIYHRQKARRGTESVAGDVGHVDHITRDRKSTCLNSSHLVISYAVFCLQKIFQETQRTVRRPSVTWRTSSYSSGRRCGLAAVGLTLSVGGLWVNAGANLGIFFFEPARPNEFISSPAPPAEKV